MRIALMADVENDFVLGGLKMSVKRHGKLCDTEIGGEVSTALGNCGNDLPTYLRGEDLKLFRGKLTDVLGGMDLTKHKISFPKAASCRFLLLAYRSFSVTEIRQITGSDLRNFL